MATFTGCTINRAAENYALETTANGAVSGFSPTFSVRFPGDAHQPGDSGYCEVDIVDFSLLLAGFGKRSADAGFDSRTDFNGDLRTDIVDFSILVVGFGSRCP